MDLILSDMAPNMSGNPAIDIPRAMALAELSLDLCNNVLKNNGNLLMKLFHGEGFDQLVRETRQIFKKVVIKKPKASRSRSRETYMLAKGFKMG